MKSVRIRSFPAFGLNSERYVEYLSVFNPNVKEYGSDKLRIQTLHDKLTYGINVVVPVQKNRDKQIVENYRLVSFLPIFGKILERLIFNLLLEFLQENNLL